MQHALNVMFTLILSRTAEKDVRSEPLKSFCQSSFNRTGVGEGVSICPVKGKLIIYKKKKS